MFGFKKPKKNFRSRRASNDSEEESKREDNDVVQVDPPPVSNLPPQNDLPPKKKKKSKKDKDSKLPKSSSTLSFGENEEEDENEDVFQVKKSSHSRRIAKMIKREHKREKEEADKLKQEQANEKTYSQVSAPGAYTADNLRALREEQNSQNGRSPAPVDMELGSDVEVDKADESSKSPYDQQEKEENDSPKERNPFGGRNIKDIFSGGQIPDAALIHEARKKRQEAREKGDFIPLDDTKKFDNPNSRLIRDDDNDQSEDEERINFSVASREQQLRMMQDTILEAEQGSHSEDSDHEGTWEEQQIRKGVSAGVANQPEDLDDTSQQYHKFYFGNAPPSVPLSSYGSTPIEQRNIVATRAAPPKNLPPITVDIIKKRLTDRLEELLSVHRAHVLERDDIASRMENCSLDSEGKGGSRGSLEERYKFFQQMRGYVRDLVECHADKMNSINFLDRCMMTQWKQRSDKIVKRRQQDIKDQSYDYMPNKAVVAQGYTDTPEDEARQRRAAEREARRARRRRGREARGVLSHHDGLSTDDEENKSELTKFQMEREQTKQSMASMYDDTLEDFQDIDLIKSRFEEWKRLQGESYEEAYIGLCLPKVFTPIIKLYLVNWNPLEENCKNFEESPWFESLMFYSYEEGRKPHNDCDLKLMPNIVDKILLPKITALVENVFDPLSSGQTRNLVRLVYTLIQDYPTVAHDNKNTQSLIDAIVQRIRRTLDDDVFMPLYPKQVLENKHSGAAQFFHRQFWSTIKLLNNIMSWHGILSDKALQHLGLDCLLNRYLVLALHNSMVNEDSILKCQAITSSFPKSWFSLLETDSTLAQLENLCRYFTNAATLLENEKNKLGAREGIKQIRKMLVTIHALDHASSLAERLTSRS